MRETETDSLIDLPIRRAMDVDYGVLRVQDIEVRRASVAADIIRNYISKKGCEHLVGLVLDQHRKAIDIRPIAIGSLKSVMTHPEKILMQVTRPEGAVSFVLAHNHPSRNLTPSDEDTEMHKWMKAVSKLTWGIEFSDGLIVADGTAKFYSFANDPLYKKWHDKWEDDWNELREKHFGQIQNNPLY